VIKKTKIAFPSKDKITSGLAATVLGIFIFSISAVHATSVSITLLQTPESITVTPASTEIFVNSDKQFFASANYSDGTSEDITHHEMTSWVSSNMLVASVVENGTYGGLTNGLTAGVTNISATYGGKTGSGVLTVKTAVEEPSEPPSGGGGGGGGSGFIDPSREEPPGPPPPGEEENAPETGEVPSEETYESEEPASESSPDETPGEAIETPFENAGENPEIPSVQIGQTLEEDDKLGSPELEDVLGVSRGEVMLFVNKEFALDYVYRDQLEICLENVSDCLSIFLAVTNYKNVVTDPENLQLYPDVNQENAYWYDINIGTLLSIVQGYYEEPESPFRPFNVISRIEATKVLLGSVDMIDWLYYPELETTFGGRQGVLAQKTVFADVSGKTDHMWWYPRYVNLGCEVAMYDCVTGSNFRPDEYITEAELKEMLSRLRAHMDQVDLASVMNADDDNDMLRNYMEKNLYFTDPQKADTDTDKLSDAEEVLTYGTSPFDIDSDNEGLSDYDEVVTYKTDPLDYDTDDDFFSDFIEINADSDPLDPKSVPVDGNNNGIEDEWENLYGLSVLDGIQDSDSDGLSDKLEYQYRTNPRIMDTDGDGLTDAEEILVYGSDPLDPNDPGNLENIDVRITNFTENQLVADTTPLIKGVAPVGAEVRILLRNDYGHEMVLGSSVAQENAVFLFQTETPLRDGRYMLVARALQPEKKSIMDSLPVHIRIDSTLDVTAPNPKKLDEKEISEDVILKNLRIKIDNNRPVLSGETQFGNRVNATWASYVITSALIADSVTGEFEIQAPGVLPTGNHEVFVTATRMKDNAQSDTIKVLFEINPPSLVSTIIKKAAEEVVPGAFNVLENSYWWIWLLVFLVLVMVSGYVYYFFIGKKAKRKRAAIKKGDPK